jgi:hypothetical protein
LVCKTNYLTRISKIKIKNYLYFILSLCKSADNRCILIYFWP